MTRRSQWIKISEQQPSIDERCHHFLVLYKNPHWISKFSNSPTPKYLPDIAMWLGGDTWVCDNPRNTPLFWAKIPSLPGE